ncbi:hypothetical protein OSTOST_17666, partial [Ostertagia ostertagi]
MAPAGQGLTWSDVLCCIVCNQCEGKYPVASYPVNAALLSIVTDDVEEYLPLWDIEKVPKEVLSLIENALVSMAQYLHRAESERGGTVFSEILSRTMQRKLVSLLCYQLVEEEGRLRALKTSRLIAERIMTELLYRASCFNVMKRDGESSLMQLKDEFRNYEALRKEHDAQIVQKKANEIYSNNPLLDPRKNFGV